MNNGGRGSKQASNVQVSDPIKTVHKNAFQTFATQPTSLVKYFSVAYAAPKQEGWKIPFIVKAIRNPLAKI